jgi:predicted P-loop ATPase/GTPase
VLGVRLVMFKDGSGNDAWYMYMTISIRLTEMRDMSAFSISASNNDDDDIL